MSENSIAIQMLNGYRDEYNMLSLELKAIEEKILHMEEFRSWLMRKDGIPESIPDSTPDKKPLASCTMDILKPQMPAPASPSVAGEDAHERSDDSIKNHQPQITDRPRKTFTVTSPIKDVKEADTGRADSDADINLPPTDDTTPYFTRALMGKPTFGMLLVALMKECRFTLQDLSTLSEISKNDLRSYISDTKVPYIRNLEKIAEVVESYLPRVSKPLEKLQKSVRRTKEKKNKEDAHAL